MTQEELNKILDKHEKWLNDEEGGERADLSGKDVQGLDFSFRNLKRAYMAGTNMEGADMIRANMIGAEMTGANMTRANMIGVNLTEADMTRANMTGTNMAGANIDFSALPLWCGGLDFKIDERQAKQLMYHVVNLMQHSELDTKKVFKKHMYKWLEDSHIVTKHDHPKLKEESE